MMVMSGTEFDLEVISMKRITLWILLFVIIFLKPALSLGQSMQKPEDVFGFTPGTDRKLIDWKQMVEYLVHLDENSDRMQVRELGKTTLGKPFIISIFSSEQNMKNLDRLQWIQQELAHPYQLSEKDVQSYIQEGKVVVLLTFNIHSTEIASSQESVELAYELVTRTDAQIQKILENVIVLIIPSANPDGLQMVVDWYRTHVGTAHEGCGMPWIYHPYAGHDDNRDWFMFNLQESRLAAQILYHEWFPEIVYDQHQMGSSGPRFFFPPYSDPVNPNVPAILMAEVNRLGKHVLADMHSQGFKGITSGMGFNAYFEGTLSKTPLWHNMVGILSEAASVRIATPVYLPRGSLGSWGPERLRYSRVTDFLDPWEGGWWHLRDIIEYEKAATYSVLDLAATYREKYLFNFYHLNKESILKGKKEPPFAYIIPPDQHDFSSAIEMLKRLTFNGVQIYQSRDVVAYDGRTYPKNTMVIPLSQPCRPCIKDLMERQAYPNLEQYPGGPPRRPYDFSGWTLPLLMGVRVVEIKEPLDIPLELTETYSFFNMSGNSLTSSEYYIIERRHNNAFILVNELLKDKKKVTWTDENFVVNQKTYPAGTFIIPHQRGLESIFDNLSKTYQVPIEQSNETISVRGSRADLPRLGLYQPWTASMDEGWTRLVLDSFRFSYKSIHNEDFSKANLSDDYDVIILPSLTTSSIVTGRRSENREPVLGTAEMPKKYQGGIGEKGISALKTFIRAGGTLITIGNSCDFAIEKLRVPAVNVLKDVDSKSFYAPGALLQIQLDIEAPLAYGMPEQAAIRFNHSPAFRLLPYIRASKAVGYYNDENPLLSGWLIGSEKLAGHTALAEIPVDKGRVILFGFGVQNRAQTFGTFKLLFNAILTSRVKSVENLQTSFK